jgi:MYXO-CTERM domain-containing protein
MIAGAVGIPSCAPYACNGINRSCPNSCLGDGDCASGNFCIFGSCTGKLPNGRPCGVAGDCQSGNCIDGVCCNTPCTGDCDVCALPGSVGTCAKAATGTDPRGLCAARPGSGACKARCGSAGLCVYPDMTTACGPGSCVGGGTPSLLQQPSVCDGQGTCIARPVIDCAPYLCSGNACPSACVDSTVCSGTNQCASGTCGQHRALAAACTVDADCDSQHCADGVCCQSACTGACQRCDLPGTVGACTVPVGSDPDNDCPGEGLCHGVCRADQSCRRPGAETACDTCKACDGNGKCNQLPQTGDDPMCMTISCGALSSECRTYADLSGMRCAAIGTCALPNDPAACNQFTAINEGQACNGGAGACSSGICIAIVDAAPDDGASTNKPGGGGSCALAPGHGAPSAWALLLLALLALFRRRRA